MPRKKKNPNPDASKSLGSSDLESFDDLPPVEEEIETHEGRGQTFRERAAEKLSNIIQENTAGDDGTVGPSGKYHRRKKARAEETQVEIATLFSSLMVLALANSSLPRELHPENNEVEVVANNLSRILSRHVDLSSKLSGDALDTIGIVIVTSGWYARVSPGLKQLRAEKQAQRQAEQTATDDAYTSQTSRALESTLNGLP